VEAPHVRFCGCVGRSGHRDVAVAAAGLSRRGNRECIADSDLAADVVGCVVGHLVAGVEP